MSSSCVNCSCSSWILWHCLICFWYFLHYIQTNTVSTNTDFAYFIRILDHLSPLIITAQLWHFSHLPGAFSSWTGHSHITKHLCTVPSKYYYYASVNLGQSLIAHLWYLLMFISPLTGSIKNNTGAHVLSECCLLVITLLWSLLLLALPIHVFSRCKIDHVLVCYFSDLLLIHYK